MKNLSLLLLMLLAFAFVLSAPANATILFVGGEDSDFVNLNGAAASTTAGNFSSGYARESMAVSGTGCGNYNSPPVNYFMTPTFSAGSTLWVHANLITGTECAYDRTSDFVRVYRPDGNARIVVEYPNVGTLGQYNIYSRNAAGTQTLLASITTACFSNARIVQMDLYINYASSGEVTLFCNGVQVADYTGNVTTDSATTLNQVQFAGIGDTTGSNYWSEIIVSTTNTRSMRLVTLPPAANGNTDTFDTGGVSNVNETTLSTANPNASGSSGEEQEYTVTTSSFPSGSFSVLGVFLNAYTQVGTTGPQHLQGVVRTASTDYTSSNYSPPQSAWGVVSIPFLTNPNTGNAWTTTNLTTTGFNIGFESQN